MGCVGVLAEEEVRERFEGGRRGLLSWLRRMGAAAEEVEEEVVVICLPGIRKVVT